MATIKELREQAKALNITGYGSMGKKELRLAVERAESAEFAQWLKDAAEGKAKVSWSVPTALFGNTDNSQAKETPAVEVKTVKGTTAQRDKLKNATYGISGLGTVPEAIPQTEPHKRVTFIKSDNVGDSYNVFGTTEDGHTCLIMQCVTTGESSDTLTRKASRPNIPEVKDDIRQKTIAVRTGKKLTAYEAAEAIKSLNTYEEIKNFLNENCTRKVIVEVISIATDKPYADTISNIHWHDILKIHIAGVAALRILEYRERHTKKEEAPAVVDYEPEFDEVCYVPDYQPMTAILDDIPEARGIVPSEPNSEQSEQVSAPTFIAGQEYYYYHETKKYKYSTDSYICGKIRVVSRDKNSICILPLSGITKHRRNNDNPYRVKLLNDKHGEYFNPDSRSQQFICYASGLVTLKKECTFNEFIQAFKQKHGDYIRFEIGKQYIPEDNANYPSFEVFSRDYEALTFGVPLFDPKDLHSADFGVTTDKQGRKTEYIKYSERYLPTTTIYASNVLPDDDPDPEQPTHIAPAPKPEPVVAQVKFIVGEQYSIISKTNGVATYKVISRAKKIVNLSWLKFNGTWSKDTWACKIVDIIDGQEVLQFPEKFFELPVYLHAEKDHIPASEARIIYAEKKNIADKATDPEPSHEDTALLACSLLPLLPDKISIHYLLLISCTEKNYLYAALIHAITRCWQAIRTSTPKRKKSRLQEFREEAKALGIKGYSRMNIGKLRDAICEVKYYSIARAEDIQRKALKQPEAITPEVLPPAPAPVPALPASTPTIVLEAEYTEKQEAPALTTHISTPKQKPHTAPKKRSKANHTNLTMQNVEACSSRETLTALFSNFSIVDISNFMLSYGVSLRPLLGTKAIKANKAGIIKYCVSKILFERNAGINHSPILDVEAYLDGKKLSFRSVNPNRKAVNL